MKKILLLTFSLVLGVSSVFGQSEEAIELYFDSGHNVCAITGNPNPYYSVELWIWHKPGPDGVLGVDFALDYPPSNNVIKGQPIWNYTIVSFALGDLETGVSVSFIDCQHDWIWIARQQLYVVDSTQTYIEVIPHQDPHIEVIRAWDCIPGYPPREIYGSRAYINYASPPIPCGPIVPAITVTSPNGGESWLAGSTQNITWTQSGLSGDVNIDLYKGSSYHSSIGTEVATAESYTWNMPFSLPEGNDFKVRIYKGSTEDYSDDNFTIVGINTEKADILGTWSSGVWYRNSETGFWVKMTTPADLVAAGDLDGDGIDDLIGVWSSGLWVKYSSSGSWAKLSATLPADIASGDMNGDGRDDILGTWASGVWYRNTDTGSWVKMMTPADLVAAGNLDGDGTDDLIGVWSSGLWVKYSSTNSWLLITPTLPASIASGDMNADGIDDILGSWPSGVWYKSSISGNWVKMSTPANLVAAGDINGDGTDDLIGTWSSGLWVKNSWTGSWQFICTSLPSDTDAGLFRTGWVAGGVSYEAPVEAVYAEAPGSGDFIDLSEKGPGGWNFTYQEQKNLMPQEIEAQWIKRTRGPGEPGFQGIEEKNQVPREELRKKKKRK